MVPAVVQAAEATLWIVKPALGADLADCPRRAASAVEGKSPDARRLTEDAVAHWAAGDRWFEQDLPLRGATGAEEDIGALAGQCFALTVDGRVTISGAILGPRAAPPPRVPVLRLITAKQGLAPRFELRGAIPSKLRSVAGVSIDADYKVGALGRLARHIGTYHHDAVLDDPEVDAALDALMTPHEKATLRTNLGVMSPIGFLGDCLILQGNKPHDGATHSAMVAIRLRDGLVHAAVREDDDVLQYRDARERGTVPDALFLWVQEARESVEEWRKLEGRR
ncbi:MAG: hypothetical protein HQL40_20920, partial [Alphaproteobacteria bacterium]|nr:hypothetical protein [Alphaproteobacteria bacterium]